MRKTSTSFSFPQSRPNLSGLGAGASNIAGGSSAIRGPPPESNSIHHASSNGSYKLGSYAKTPTPPISQFNGPQSGNWKPKAHARKSSLQFALNEIRRRSGSTTEIVENLKAPISYKLVSLCIVWYLSSALTNTSSKSILIAFPQPVTLTIVQFWFVAAWCILLGTLSQKWPALAHMVPALRPGIRSPTRYVLRTTAPLALFQVGGHITSSFATSRIPVSLVHTIKGLSPLFTVFAYRTFYDVRYSRATYISLIPLTMGVMLACSFEFRGNFLGVISAFVGAMIFVTQNIVSKKIFTESSMAEKDPLRVGGTGEQKLDKLNLLCYSSGMAFLLTVPLWLYSEGGVLIAEYISRGIIPMSGKSGALTEKELVWEFVFNGTSHFGQNIIAFVLLSMVSPVTYSVASLVKRIFVIVLAIIWFGNKTTNIQAVGIGLTFFGLYLYDRAGDLSKKERLKVNVRDPILPINQRGGGSVVGGGVLGSASYFTDSPVDMKLSTNPRPNGHALSPAPDYMSGPPLLPGARQEDTWRPREVSGSLRKAD